jgi:hypothetical protein
MSDRSTIHTSLPVTTGDFYQEWEKLLMLCTQIPPETEIIQTIVLPTGFFSDRIGAVLEEYKELWWTQKRKPKLLISGNISEPIHQTGSAEEIKHIYEYYGNITKAMDTHIVTDMLAENTKENAVNTYRFLQENRIHSPLLVMTSVEHLPRMYSTLVKVILDNEKDCIKTKVYSLPIERHWNESLPGDARQKPRILYVPSEMERILAYRKTGDVATEEEVKKYITFLRKGK